MAFQDTNAFSITIKDLVTVQGDAQAGPALSSGTTDAFSYNSYADTNPFTVTISVLGLVDVQGSAQADPATSAGAITATNEVLVQGGAQAGVATSVGQIITRGSGPAQGDAKADDAVSTGTIQTITYVDVQGGAQADAATSTGQLQHHTTIDVQGNAQATTAVSEGFIRGPGLAPPYDLRMQMWDGGWITITDHNNLLNVDPDSHHNQAHLLYGPDHSDVDSTGTPQIRDLLAFNDSNEFDLQRRLNFVRPYVFGDDYEAEDAVYDDGWTMVANKQTTDRAAPQPSGTAFNIYDGTSPTAPVTVKQIIFGNRYTFGIGGYVNGYRIYITAGNTYSVYRVIDPLGAADTNNLALFTASSTGWADFGMLPIVVPVNTVLDLVVVVQEPDPTPTTFVGDWNYTKPNNTGTPGAGVIIHANKATDQFRIHKTDNDSVDRSADLATLTVGDVIDWGGGGTRWAIQSIIDNGTWYNFGVSPATQEGATGNHTFTFETVTATPIARMEDANWWGLNPPVNGTVQGLYIEDDEYANIVPNTSAYGSDLLVQNADISDDWDLLAVGEGAGGSNASEVGISTVTALTMTSGNAWTDVNTLPLDPGTALSSVITVTAQRTDGIGRYFSEWAVLVDNDTGVNVEEQNLFELGDSLLNVRIVAGINQFTVQVRGRPHQDWTWKLIAQYTEQQ